MNTRIVVCIAALAVLAGCGHKASTTRSSVNSSPLPAASAATMRSEGGAAAASQAPVPSSMDCGGAQPVWINEKTHVYHTAGDPYYGKTKHGRYLCERDARKEGYHAAK